MEFTNLNSLFLFTFIAFFVCAALGYALVWFIGRPIRSKRDITPDPLYHEVLERSIESHKRDIDDLRNQLRMAESENKSLTEKIASIHESNLELVKEMDGYILRETSFRDWIKQICQLGAKLENYLVDQEDGK